MTREMVLLTGDRVIVTPRASNGTVATSVFPAAGGKIIVAMTSDEIERYCALLHDAAHEVVCLEDL